MIFDVVRKLLAQTKTKARDIDILIINCSLFSPTPSLCSMVINEFGLKSDVSSYNLSGMVRNSLAFFPACWLKNCKTHRVALPV